MGVAGLWEILRPVGQQRSLLHLSVVDGFQENTDGKRGYRIGIDASIWFFHATGWANSPSHGENPELRTLFFRLARMLALPLLPLFVFDGPERPAFKRGKRVGKNVHWLTAGMQQIIDAYGFEWRTAPGEAEAELAYLNRIGVIDAVISDDVDNFLFGSTVVIRNPSATLSGNHSHPTKNSAGVDDKLHVMIYRADRIQDELGLTRGGCILVGLMGGGDYHPAGVPGCGPKTAHGLARAGFGDSLFEAFITLPRHELSTFLDQWRADLRRELATDSRGFLGKKYAALSRKIPETFPDLDVLECYVVPVTSESLGRNVDIDRMWRNEVNIAKIAQCCELFFEWGYKELIIKRFRTFLWGGVCMRVLRRAVMDSDEKEVDSHYQNRDYRGENGDDVMASPRKTGRRAHGLAVGTPSGLIRHYFQDMHHAAPSKFGCDSGDEYGGEGKELLTRITRSREHASTDGLVEYRVEVYPSLLVRLAESGIKGLRLPLQDDLGPGIGEDEDDEGDEGEGGSKKKKPKKPPPHPEEPMLMWLPAVMLEMAVPGIVEEFEGTEHSKARKKQETEQRKKDRAEGKIVPPQAKAEKADARAEGECHITPTQGTASTARKRKDGQSQSGAIAKTFKVTKKKPAAGGDKGKGNRKKKFITPSSDNSDVEEGSEGMPTSQKLSISIATTAPKQITKRSMFDELLDDVIAPSPPNPPYSPKPFDTADENPLLGNIPAPSANNSKGKTKPAIAVPPEPKLQDPNPPPASTRTARERIKFLFTQNPDYFSPSPDLGGDEEGDLHDPYVGLVPIPLMPTNVRTISASTKASGSGSSRSNSTGSGASVGATVPKGRATMEEDEVESFEDLFADARPLDTSKRPKPQRKAQESTMSNVKPFRFVLPESPTPEPDLGRRAPPKPRTKAKERARPASSRSSTATAEDTDESEEGGARKRSRQSRALEPPGAEEWVGVTPLEARGPLVLPSRKGGSKVADLIELSDSEEEATRTVVQTLVKPTSKTKATSMSATETAKGVSKTKPKIADVSIIDLDSD